MQGNASNSHKYEASTAKFKLWKTLVAAVTVLPLFSHSASAQIGKVSINSINAGGDGCPQGTYSGQITATKPGGLPDLLIIFFDEYEAAQGQGVAPTERQKNCNLAINIGVPQGYQFSLFQAQYDGYADLPSSVRGIQRTTYSFPFTNQATFATVINGPYQGAYQRFDNIGLESVVWSPCGAVAPLNLRTSVALQGSRTPSASMNLEQFTARVEQVYGVQWRQCSAK